MASKLDLTGLTEYVPKAVMDLKEVIKQELFKESDLSKIVTIEDGIAYSERVGYMGELGDIGYKSANTGCDLNEVTVSASTVQKTWAPEFYDSRIILCKDNIDREIGRLGLKKGIDMYDMTESDYYDMFIDEFKKSLLKMYNRLIWMSDKQAENVNVSPSAGRITAGVEKKLFTTNEGLFKRLRQIVAASPDQKVTIAANAQSTYATQKSTLTAAVAMTIAKKLYNDADLNIKTRIRNGEFVAKCTLDFWDKLAENYTGYELETMFKNQQDGVKRVSVLGLEFEAVPEWDFMINKFENTGTKWIEPHRVVLYSKDNALFGVPSTRTWGMFDAFFERKDRKIYIDLKDAYDTMFLHDNLVMYAV